LGNKKKNANVDSGARKEKNVPKNAKTKKTAKKKKTANSIWPGKRKKGKGVLPRRNGQGELLADESRQRREGLILTRCR